MSHSYSSNPCWECGDIDGCHERRTGIDEVKSQWTFQDEIEATGPWIDGAPDVFCEADTLAMKLVGERHEKRDLVDLVRWLIVRKPEGLI